MAEKEIDMAKRPAGEKDPEVEVCGCIMGKKQLNKKGLKTKKSPEFIEDVQSTDSNYMSLVAYPGGYEEMKQAQKSTTDIDR